MTAPSCATVLAAALAALAAPPAARAGEVAPGQSISGKEADGFDPAAAPVSGDVLAERSTPFAVADVTEPEFTFSRGTFTTRVVREAGQAGLTFVYLLREDAGGGIVDLEPIRITGLGRFSTDVYSSTLASSNRIFITRSADGDALEFFYNAEHLSETIIVRTDAPAFADDGTLRVRWDMPGTNGDTRGTLNYLVYRPVPEAAAGLLAVAAMVPLLGRRRRNRPV